MPETPRDDASFAWSTAWFDAWDAAYLAGRAPREIGGLRLLDERARLGPIAYRRRRARTNPHTALFDSAAPLPSPSDLLAGADVIVLDYLPAESPVLAAGWTARIAPHAVAPVADCRGSYAEWLARRSKRIRQRWPRLEREALGKHGLVYERIERFDDLPMLLAELFALERSGWKGREHTAIADSPADTLFYTALATRAAAAGALRIAVLRQDSRIVAFEYAVLGDATLHVLKVGYDEALDHASIGHVLAAMHVRDCCGDPRVDWYDQLGNGMTPAPYKLRYADALAVRMRVTLYAPTLRGQLVRLHDAAREAGKGVRDRWRARKKAR